MTRLMLVRHGLTEYNNTRKFGGHSDVELNDEGRIQAEKVRTRLVGEKIDAIYSSDLKRAISTVEIISDGREVETIICPELREMNYGDAEGMTFDEIGRKYPGLREMIIDFDMQLEFPGGESLSEFIERTITFMDRINNQPGNQVVLIVSHSGPLKVLVCHLLGLDQSHWPNFRIDNASLSIIDIHPRGTMLSLLNETAYLK